MYYRTSRATYGLMAALWVPLIGTAVFAIDPPGWQTCKQDLRLPGGSRIVSVSTPPAGSRGKTPADSSGKAWPHPRLPLDGFSPLVAIAVTNHAVGGGQSSWEHLLAYSFTGTALNPPAATNFAIGICDSGAVVDLVGYCSSGVLGLTGAWLTDNTIGVSGVSGTIECPISYPVGMYANGLQAIDGDGRLDTTQLVGHGNVALVVTPPEACGDGPELPPVIGNTFVGFFTTVIRMDRPRVATVREETYMSPEVTIVRNGDPSVPTYPRSIRMNVSGPGFITTAAYFPDILDPIDPDKPWFPTLLAAYNGALPLGGAFYAEINVLQGVPGPTNPIKPMRVMVDTGAQSSIMTPGMASNLSLPVEPDFTVDVLGVGGLIEDVPGYFIDYVKINALGGALEFSHVPFVVLGLSSPDGGEMDGVLGMNFFYNRNIVFQPVLQGDGAIKVSNPVISYGDFDRDTDVDAADLETFESCLSGANVPQDALECLIVDADGDGDVDLDDFGVFQRCLSGDGAPSDPSCAL